MSNTPSDAELDELIFDVYPTYQAPEALDRIQIREAMKKAVAKWGTPQPAPECHHRPPCAECAARARLGEKT